MHWKLTNYVSHTAKLITGETNVVDTKVVSCRKKTSFGQPSKTFSASKTQNLDLQHNNVVKFAYSLSGEYNNIIIMIITLLYAELLPLIYN